MPHPACGRRTRRGGCDGPRWGATAPGGVRQRGGKGGPGKGGAGGQAVAGVRVGIARMTGST